MKVIDIFFGIGIVFFWLKVFCWGNCRNFLKFDSFDYNDD